MKRLVTTAPKRICLKKVVLCFLSTVYTDMLPWNRLLLKWLQAAHSHLGFESFNCLEPTLGLSYHPGLFFKLRCKQYRWPSLDGTSICRTYAQHTFLHVYFRKKKFHPGFCSRDSWYRKVFLVFGLFFLDKICKCSSGMNILPRFFEYFLSSRYSPLNKIAMSIGWYIRKRRQYYPGAETESAYFSWQIVLFLRFYICRKETFSQKSFIWLQKAIPMLNTCSSFNVGTFLDPHFLTDLFDDFKSTGILRSDFSKLPLSPFI